MAAKPIVSDERIAEIKEKITAFGALDVCVEGRGEYAERFHVKITCGFSGKLTDTADLAMILIKLLPEFPVLSTCKTDKDLFDLTLSIPTP